MWNRISSHLPSSSLRQQIYLGGAQGVAHCGLIYAGVEFSGPGFLLSFVMYFLMTSVGISVTSHRFLSHRSFYMPRWCEVGGGILSCLALQGSTLAWVAMHREHHHFSDKDKDPHCPREKFLQVHFFSMFYRPKLKYVLDLLRDPFHQRLHRWYWLLNISFGLFLILNFGIWGLVYIYLIPAALTWHSIGMAKTLAHKWGYRNFETRDDSRNLPLIGYFTFGEGWHNNHHAYPRRWSFKRRWYEWDLSAFLIRFGIKFLKFRSEKPS